MELLTAILLIVTCTAAGAAAGRYAARKTVESAEREPTVSERAARSRRRRLARQYENMLRYDGTARGQRDINGEGE